MVAVGLGLIFVGMLAVPLYSWIAAIVVVILASSLVMKGIFARI